ncbi:MAG: hypothetical protein SVJ22_06250 [Halobacteriota archaeon]|nr:hypothetical protein [Halobacteriota archaeon]
MTVLAVFFLLSDVSAAEAPLEEWNRTFGGLGIDKAYSVQQTEDGGYILAGDTDSYGSKLADAWLIKTDSEGFEEWNRTFGGLGIDKAYSVQQTEDGGYILAGDTDSYGSKMADAWLIKTDSEGFEEWNRTYGNQEFIETAYSVRQTSDGGYILVSSSMASERPEDNLFPKFDAWIIKTDSKGVEEWNRTYGGEYFDALISVQQTKDGGYILAGHTDGENYGAFVSDAWLIKTDSEGFEVWNRTFGGEKIDYAHCVQEVIDGGYILAGETDASGSGGSDAWLIKTDSEGFEEWNRTYGGQEYIETAYFVEETSDGGYILASSSTSTEWLGDNLLPEFDAWIIKTDSKGVEEWNKTFGGDGFDIAYSIQETSDGGYVFTAKRIMGSYMGGKTDVVLVKIEGEGGETDAFTPGFEILTGLASAAIIAKILVLRRKRI